MTIIVKTFGVSVEEKYTAKGGYKIATVDYEGNGQRRKQKVMSFGEQADVFLVLTANPVGTYSIETKKNGNFDNWVKALPVADVPVAQSSPAQSNAGYSSGRSFETAEERAERQVLIVRQSVLDRAVQTLAVGAKAAPKKEDVVDLAQYYYDWVFGAEQAKKDPFEEDIPY